VQYRKDIKSGNELSALGFGCMRFPKSFGAFDIKKSESLVMRAIEGGVNYFDTARLYQGNEEALGTILANNPGSRDKIHLATKLPVFLTRSARDIDAHFNASLEKLKTDHVDYYLMHMLSQKSAWETLCGMGIEEWIVQKKKSGQIVRICFSFHGLRDEFMQILDAYDWDMAQIQYNYSDENYQAGVEGLKAAHNKGIPVVIMEPLLGGRLANRLPQAALDAFHQTHADWSAAAWGLNWLWNQKEVTVVLSGMNEMEQLEDNLAAVENARPLNETEMATIAAAQRIFNASNKIKCTGCSYCIPCPRDINIPDCFSAYNMSFQTGVLRGVRLYGQSIGFTSKNMHNAGRCIGCGKCEKHCPQNLPIRESLKRVKKRLEPFWFWWTLKIIRKFMKF
jgi:predicted aldo/keto reductase-like oxidoreductase